MIDHGATTLDILALGHTHPAEQQLHPREREDASQAAGQRQRRLGASILVGAIVTALACAVIAEGQVFHNGNAQIFAGLGMFACIAIGAIIFAAGVNERREQHLRAMMRLVVTQSGKNTEQLELLVEMVNASTERLALIEEHLINLEQIVGNVPGYGEAIMDGIALGRGLSGGDQR